MVAMARALMMEPTVLLLDEPSAGLSPVRQDETFIRTRRINKAGVCVIMVEQNARRCLQICDRGYVLDQGRDAYTGTGRELANDPKVIELYLGTLAEDVDEPTGRPERQPPRPRAPGPRRARALRAGRDGCPSGRVDSGAGHDEGPGPRAGASRCAQTDESALAPSTVLVSMLLLSASKV